MSQESLGRFLEKAMENDSLKADVEKALSATDQAQKPEALVTFANKHGFDVQPEDARSLQEALARRDELNDRELNSVAGGSYPGAGLDFGGQRDPIVDWIIGWF